MSDRIYMSSPDVGELEEKFVLDALRSGWVAPLGPDVDSFEAEVAARVGVSHAVALSSGTAALHLALLSHGIGDGDLVLTSTMTFAATANAIRYTGAQPFFVDSDATGNISINLLEQAAEQLALAGRPAKAIVPVDLLGKICDFQGIERVAQRFGLLVIADAAESLGASRGGQPAGSFGDAAIVSFNGNKIMTTSGGGMLLTDSSDTARRARYLATQARQPVAHYEHVDIGFNYRMSNLLAALGRAQLLRLDEMIAKRKRHRATYREFFQYIPGVEVFGGDDDQEDNCWLTSIVIDPANAQFTSSQLAEFLLQADIEARPLWKPMHLQPVFAQAESIVDGTSERFFLNGLTLPSGSALEESQVERIFNGLSSFLEEAR
ncbi:DegT/DnrJ/EryC1/StrS family aminotransferase [Pseudarthrobacter sp. C1]|uniref:DegT/DnrJ/EryC1/StrS family aminotransferase n=1 Tax=Pseudarthrobacter sp. C1 TaxID=3108940 RepID=UPI002B05B374|nr:aminotransferase class I/II-fold pyridoxal phosphate-dependent enzyme [Pseudarthrobacter sp. C1]MEA3550223.1 aminotransferase class I/II-fold pyridoxal phosphate-dependent enzyme [Pseudarthrobacter sp. C1]